MRYAIALPAVLLSLAASAAGPKTRLIDHSVNSLIEEAAAKAVMAENIPAKVWKLYPASKFAFVSQVEGGLTRGDMCVVTARVMLVPLTPTMKAVLLRPQKTATAFDAIVKSSREQCQALARDKLKEATTAVVSDLIKI